MFLFFEEISLWEEKSILIAYIIESFEMSFVSLCSHPAVGAVARALAYVITILDSLL